MATVLQHTFLRGVASLGVDVGDGPHPAVSDVMPVTRRLPLSLVAAAVLVLNLADAVFTLVYLRTGMAREGNPMMESALGAGPVAFMIVKLSLVSLGVLLLARHHHRRSASVALVGAAVAYSGLIVYHLSAVPGLLVA